MDQNVTSVATATVALAAAPAIVHVLIYDTKNGSDISAYATMALARTAKAQLAIDSWSNRAEQGILTHEGLSKDQIIAAYFDSHEREFASIESIDVHGSVQFAMLQTVDAYDKALNDLEIAPNGDDYNDLVRALREAAATGVAPSINLTTTGR